ncbi:NRDE family protein [Pigmentiphaga aceris]|uniref:NRDE family protein n=1 Tax=Pigmentiphaga aceris TaxID=1940612 RepID=A0A5C0AWM7_9BURK|nr:NRDE family protein [Pigmentiphaga aceris]QEI06809.1 NRDE family protein [Pigmentiphaga aceris]
MCLLAFAWDPKAANRFVLAANRDEYYARPSVPAGWWASYPDLWGGQDLQAGGTWMGITRGGRFAAITNVREPQTNRAGMQSRGLLVLEFLTGLASPEDYLEAVEEGADQFRGFNLLVGELYGATPSLWYYSNRGGEAPCPLSPGVYGLSNASLDTPWPKVVSLTSALTLLKAADAPLEAYLRPLADRHIAPDQALPSTGVTLAMERMLSAPFIISPDYGTRSQTVLIANAQRQVDMMERSFDNADQATLLAPASVHSDRFMID